MASNQKDLGNFIALRSGCAPALEPVPSVVLALDVTDGRGKVLTVQIAFPASGVQGLRRNLRTALMEIPVELRQEAGGEG